MTDNGPTNLGHPENIGHYRVEGLLGTGGFATVYLARDERLSAQVAVKVLADNHSRNPDIRRRFIDEGQVIRRLDSERIIKVYDIGETDAGQPYLVLELADLGDLRRRVDQLQDGGWSPTTDDLVAFVQTLGSAMTVIHHHDLVHRDLNPGNILFRTSPGRPSSGGLLVGADERMMVSDLGLAKDLAQNSGFTIGAGTSAFQAPEQAVAYGAIDHRADLYSASALLVWMLTGAGPRDLSEWQDVVRYQGWPASFVAVLDSSLNIDPDGRPATAEDWQRQFETPLFTTSGSSASRAIATPFLAPPSAAVPTKSSLSRRTLLGSLAAIVVLGGGGVAWLTSDSGPKVERLDNGDARITVTANSGEELSIEGPDRLTVGDVGRFDAVVAEGLVEPQWLAPDGQRYENEPTIEVDAVSAGRAPVLLSAQTPTGETVSVTLEVEISN